MRSLICVATMLAACGGGGLGSGDDLSTPGDFGAPDLAPPPAHCTDHSIDGDETDVDCGGSCPACATGRMCLHAADCASALCLDNVCIAPTGDGGVPSLLPSFAPAAAFGATQRPQLVALGDVAGDGALDVVVGDFMASSISVLIGGGDGTFGLPHSTNTVQPNFVVALDLSHDGKADLLVGGSGSTFAEVDLLVSNGDGTFQPIAPLDFCNTNTGGSPCPQGGRPMGATVADLNNDARPDVVFTQQSFFDDGVTDPTVGNVSAILQTAGGPTIAGPSSAIVTRQGSAGAIAAGDFDTDGNIDVAVADPINGSPAARLLLGNGDGTFQPATQIAQLSSMQILAFAAGDFNNDGKLDLVGGGNQLLVSLGKGDGTFKAPKTTIGGPTTSVAVADFNDDGRLDIAATEYYAGAVAIALGNGDGTFLSVNLPAGVSPTALAVGDLNGDGKPDIVVVDTTAVQVLLNTTP